jgi:nitroreductase
VKLMGAAMTNTGASPVERVRPLLRVRQVREFTQNPVATAELDAVADVARWSGSSRNSQPWRFITIRDEKTLRALAVAGAPQTRLLDTAPAAIAIVLPADESHQVSYAFDEGRAAERMLIAASPFGLGAGICWIRSAALPAVRPILALPEDRLVRTIVAIGHPTDAARRPKSAPGQGRLPREQVVFEGRWPAR